MAQSKGNDTDIFHPYLKEQNILAPNENELLTLLKTAPYIGTSKGQYLPSRYEIPDLHYFDSSELFCFVLSAFSQKMLVLLKSARHFIRQDDKLWKLINMNTFLLVHIHSKDTKSKGGM